MRTYPALLADALACWPAAPCQQQARPHATADDQRRRPSRPICRRASPPASMTCRRRRAITPEPDQRSRQCRSLLALSFFYSTTSGDFDAAGKYASPVVAATPDDRAARLALAVVGFKHQDYAEVRKQLVAVGQGAVHGPDPVAVRRLGRGGLARHRRHGQGHEGPGGAEGRGKHGRFPRRAAAGLSGQCRGGRSRSTRRRWRSTAPTPRVLEAYGRFLERAGPRRRRRQILSQLACRRRRPGYR